MTVFMFSILPKVFADGGTHGHETFSGVDWLLSLESLSISLWGSLLIFLLALFAYVVNSPRDRTKNLFFWSICAVSIAVTAVFVVQTMIKNYLSETGGPVHWHADFEIYDCGEELDLIDPTGLLNRVGTPLLHEHGDKRIHVEGTLLKKQDASLGTFFDVVGGSLTDNSLMFPTNTGDVLLEAGKSCEGENEPSELQVFVWTVEEGVATQRKLEDPASYVPSPYSYVPPGDCIIVELTSEKERTAAVCEQYEVAEQNEELVIDLSQ
jgi:hypothetical protein